MTKRRNLAPYILLVPSLLFLLVFFATPMAQSFGLALQDRPIRATVVPVDPPLERRVSVAVKPARRAHPAVAAMLEELSAAGGVTM